MDNLKDLLIEFLTSLHPRVFHLVAPPEAAYPYLVVDVYITEDGEGMLLGTVDIDGWSLGEDTTALENLMKLVDDNLNKKTLSNPEISVTFYRDSRRSLTDDDPSLRRRKTVYQARAFERS